MTRCIVAASVRPPPHLSLEYIQDASPSSASKLTSSSGSVPKTRKLSPAHRLWHGLLPVLLLLALLFGLAAPNESHAQTSCDVSTARSTAENTFNYHRISGGDRNAPTATASYRVLIAIDPNDLPEWSGSNLSGNAPTTAITEAELRTFLTDRGDTWSGWNAVYTALNCLEGLPVITISGGSAVTEGTGAQFTVNINSAPSSNLTVDLNVSDAAGSDFVASSHEGSQTVEITAGQISATYTVPTVSDTNSEASGDVTVMVGGDLSARVYRVGSPSSATVTVNDDDPGITLSVPGPLRLLETGTATYTVVLNAEPTADVRVSLSTTAARLSNGDANAATIPFELTFTHGNSGNWSQPQTVTVTGSDEADAHRNRSLRVHHTALSDDTRYSSLSTTNLLVHVDDAPEVEAWDTAVWNVNDFAAKQRPNTVKETRGFRYFQNDFVPTTRLFYKLRLSNRPATGEAVTVTATSSDPSKFGLSLTGYGAPQDSLTVTFEDRPADRVCYIGSIRFAHATPSTATSWECYRRIWVINKQSKSDSTAEKGCADISHTASGGGVRSTYVGSIRAHAVAGAQVRSDAPGRGCPLITGTDEAGDDKTYTPTPPASAEATPAPTEAVSNLQVTAVDDTSASVTWDAVAYATSYEVSWSAESSDSLNASAGALPGVTGTSATIDHGASVPMMLTVTVTPEYVNKNGVTQQLDALAGTATLAIGPSGQRLESGGGTNGGNGGSIDSGYGAVDLPVPVSHWRFEYDAVDWVGSSHGTESGGVAFEANEEGEGVDDHALSLDGSDDYVDLSTHVSDFPLGDSTRSVTGWFKADTGNQGQTFFAYGPNVAGKRFSIAADRTQVLVAVSGHAWGVNGLELQEGWHHVAVTYAGGDSDDILIYLDGELQSASTLVGSPKRLDTGTGPAAIGRNVGGTKHYTGLIDDVRLYDVVLSAEQVLALFEEHPQTVLAEDNKEVCVSDELLADVEGYSEETWRESADHVERWLRVLETFSGTANDSRVMTPTEAEGYANRGWQRWEPVLEALECLEQQALDTE